MLFEVLPLENRIPRHELPAALFDLVDCGILEQVQKPAAGSASKTRQKPHAGSASDRPNSHRVPTNPGHSWSEACSRNIYLSFDGASFGAFGDAIPSSVFFTGDGTTSIATPSS